MREFFNQAFRRQTLLDACNALAETFAGIARMSTIGRKADFTRACFASVYGTKGHSIRRGESLLLAGERTFLKSALIC